MDIEHLSITGSVDGAIRVSLRHSTNIFTMRLKFLRSSLILRWFGPTLAQLVPKKGGQATACLGRNWGGFTTKLNFSLSDAWMSLRLILTSGNRNDITQASALIQGYCYKSVIGDKAYNSDAFREEIASLGGVAVIPPRDSHTAPYSYDEELYKPRNIIERFFHRLKQYRRVATRYDKLGIRYLGFVYFAPIPITAKKM